ncbi:hypothetical protein E4U35_003095 [Claviceps purpurea]|nr:hypothetical protein E4U35_003095 [Claviceps purpurea]KAG6231256.1 hypothetical protein E4U26_007054 [Claviceps purpurea]KAG6253124.1 hypothetical protein E4U23_008085 [Claviceps purpurea]
MLKIASVLIAALAAIGPVVQAASTCTPGLDYCGFTLERNGWGSGLPTDGLGWRQRQIRLLSKVAIIDAAISNLRD